jgi:hypothetical protein
LGRMVCVIAIISGIVLIAFISFIINQCVLIFIFIINLFAFFIPFAIIPSD